MLRSLFHRTMKTLDPKCANATIRDRPAPSATIRSDLSRWRHGFEPRWDCSSRCIGAVLRTVGLHQSIDPLVTIH